MSIKHSPKCIPYLAKTSAIPRSKGGHWRNKLDKHDAIKQEIHKIDEEHDSKQIKSTKKKQQKKISKQPAQANQEILGGK